MKLKPPPEVREVENILPLVNVVFLLLIFFMLAGAFSRPDAFKVELPLAENENDADRKVLTVLLNSEGQLALDDSLINIVELQELITAEVNNNSLLQLQLKADANVNATELIEIMESLNATGLVSLRLLTIHPDT